MMEKEEDRAGFLFVPKKMKAMELGAAAVAVKSGVNRGVAILDFILRLVAIVATLASAVAMGTTNETLPFFTQFIRFSAQYEDFPTFTFFVVANSVVSVYLVLSLALSIFHILRSHAHFSRIILIFFDTVFSNRFRGGCHRVPSAQGEHKGKLVCNLPAVQLLLPADLGLLDRFLRRNPDSHPVDLDVCCCTLSTLIRFADGRVTESSDLDEACVMSKGSCFLVY
ncbi:hypothetical protein RHGRI_023023 [Rhododendron griersonianum]|uniref:CASP-like protein n=1 Tax=Rhododendron griersonianum TaxID=479676 RepID=A0AAV6J3N1_9ERIC|nr:hypothetical protein RHGRI_023023 [Rhododendron griersonianum]